MFLSQSTFVTPQDVENLPDAQMLFERWMHTHDSGDIRKYKSLTMPPKSKSQMLHHACMQREQDESVCVEFGHNSYCVKIHPLPRVGKEYFLFIDYTAVFLNRILFLLMNI
jgi:hypothetical protein